MKSCSSEYCVCKLGRKGGCDQSATRPAPPHSVQSCFRAYASFWNPSCEHSLTCIYVYMYICIYVYMYICIYVYLYICIYVYMYICIYVYMYICIYTYMHIHMYMYIQCSKQSVLGSPKFQTHDPPAISSVSLFCSAEPPSAFIRSSQNRILESVLIRCVGLGLGFRV